MNLEEEWLANQLNDGREPLFCSDSTLRSPIDIQGHIHFRDFTVKTLLNNSYKTSMTKVSDHAYKLDGQFGHLQLNNTSYKILYAVFRGPSEHRVSGERLPLELQVVSKSPTGQYLTALIMFKISDEENLFMKALGFGNDTLVHLANKDPLRLERHSYPDLAVSLSPFFINSDEWLLYEGHSLNPPCKPSLWIISVQPVPLHSMQLLDFNTAARPDFTIKTIGERWIFKNKAQFVAATPTHKQLAHLNEVAILEMRKKMANKKEEKIQKVRAAMKAQDDHAKEIRRIVKEYQTNKIKLQFVSPPRAGEEPMITEGYLKGMFDEINMFNFLNTPCPAYVKYLPPLDKPYGYVPADAVMPWEIRKFVSDNKEATIANSIVLPTPVNSSYSFQTFYYIPKPDCHKEPAYRDTHLAQTEASASETNNTVEYVPVIVETTKDTKGMDVPSTTLKMVVPGKLQEVVDIPIMRTLIPEDERGWPLQDIALANLHKDTFGHRVVELQEPPFIPVPLPNGTLNSRGKVIRVWPELVTSYDGILPQDAIPAWEGIGESELILNTTVPASFDPNYRWVLYMWIRANYWVGDEEKVPLLPVYILARKDFIVKKGEKPLHIPVPRTVDKINGEVPAELITLSFSAVKGSQLLPKPEILDLPVGYEAEKIFKQPQKYREEIFFRHQEVDAVYFNEVHSRWLNSTNLTLLEPAGREAEKVEVTGIIINPDAEYRQKQAARAAAEREKVRLQIAEAAEREKQLKSIFTDKTRVVSYERYCVKWELEMTINDRFNFIDRDRTTPDYRYCAKWAWREVKGPNQLYQAPDAVNNTQPAAAAPPAVQKAQEEKKKELKEQVVDQVEDFCRNKVHVVLNDREKRADDPHYKLCQTTLDKIRKTDLKNFIPSLRPALQNLKKIVYANAEMLDKAGKAIGVDIKETAKSGVRKIQDAAKRIGGAAFDAAQQAVNDTARLTGGVGMDLKNAFDKSQRAPPTNIETRDTPQLAQTSLKEVKRIDRLYKVTRKLWRKIEELD